MNRCALALVSLVVAGSAQAATQLSAGSVSVAPGGSVELPITLSSDVPITAFQAELLLSPATAGLSVPPAGPLARQINDGEAVSAQLFRLVSYNLLNSPIPNGTVATVTCSIPSTFGTGTISVTLTNVLLASPAGLPVSGATFGAGSIRVGVANVQIRSVTAANGRIQIEIGGLPAGNFVVEGSSDLRTWTTLDTQSTTGSAATYSRAIAGGQARQFYRVRLP